MADTGLISISDSSNGITGSTNVGNYGVVGIADSGHGVVGSARTTGQYGVYGQSQSNYGIYCLAGGSNYAICASGNNYGLIGSSINSCGVYGFSNSSSYGIVGSAKTLDKYGLLGISDSGHGIACASAYGISDSGCGIAASSSAGSTAYLRIVPQASAPASASMGDLYVDTNGVLWIYTTAWTKVGTQ